MKFKHFYLAVPLTVFCVALIGQHFTGMWMEWYTTLHLPRFTPPGAVIGIIWTIIFVLSTISAIRFFTVSDHDKKSGIVVSLFIDNAILNILRSWLFFVQHWILASIFEMIILFVTTLILIIAIWSRSKLASILLMPYAIWLIIATSYAMYIYSLN